MSEEIFASCSSDKKVLFWNVSTMKVEKTWECEIGTKSHILSLCRLDDKTVAMGGQDRVIRIYDWMGDSIVSLLKGHKGGVNCLLSLSEDVIASCGSDNAIIIWNWKHQ